MRLLSLALQNFKGHKDLTVNFDDVTVLSGANGTGKTSVYDSFCWLLTGKDAQGRVCGTGQKGEATIRPRGLDGELVRQVEVSVTGRLMNEDGEVYTLQRVYCEQYSADKNSGEKIFKGNTTKYFINNVPTPAAKYDAWVKANVDPDRMKLTSDPAYFPGLPWQDQRALLLQVAGDVDDAAVIASDKDLAPLAEALKKHSIEDIKAMASAQLKLANKAVKEGVVRVDQTMKLAGNVTEADLTAEITRQDELLKAQNEMVTQAESALAAAKAAGQTGRLQAELDAWKMKVEAWEERRHNKIVAINDEFRRRSLELQGTIESKRAQLADLISRLKAAETRKQNLYEDYDAVYARTFTETECPTCHQPLPADKVAELREQFNQEKARTIEAIVADGKQTAAKIKELEARRDSMRLDIDTAEKALAALNKNHQAMLDKLPQLEDVPEFREVRANRDRIARQLAGVTEEPDLEPLQANLNEACYARDMLLNKRARLQSNLDTLRAIGDLQAELQTQRENADAASAKLRLITAFVAARCRLVSDKVNTLFPGLEWQLFTRNITNDDLVETCELRMHGVGYRDLSQGEKIKAGLIIVNTLQEKLQTVNPVWIDGAESITFTPVVKGQLVLLKAQENIKTLKVEGKK